MTRERTIKINGKLVEEYIWNSKPMVYVDGWRVMTTYEETCKILLPSDLKIVKNLLTKKDVVIAKNTPLYCDPSSEMYWKR